VYRRTLEGREFTFGVSGMLLHNALLLFDRETRTLWSHLTGEALAGPQRGKRLFRLQAAPVASWEAIRQVQPATQVLVVAGQQDVPLDSYLGYHADPGANGIRPVTHRDDRLPGKSLVLGVRAEGESRAYPLSRLSPASALQDRLATVPLVVARDDASGIVVAYRRRVENRLLEFESRVENGKVRDRTTGTTWDLIRGVGTAGSLAGRRLEAVDAIVLYWFGWVDYYPKTTVYGG